MAALLFEKKCKTINIEKNQHVEEKEKKKKGKGSESFKKGK